MKRGGYILCSVAVLAITACTGTSAKLQIRSIPAPLSATVKPVPHRIAEAHGHLALGNVALAIESFRKALREQPDSVDAMVGLAASYDRMTRFDLSRRYYESALAIVPADTRVLNAFAGSLDAQGESVEAAAVRSEIRVRSAAAAPQAAPAIQAPLPKQKMAQALPPVVGPSITIKLPPARPAATVAAMSPAELKAASAPSARSERKMAKAVLPTAPAPEVVAPKRVESKPVAPVPMAPIAVAEKPERTRAPAPVPIAVKPVEAKLIASPPPLARAAKPAEPKAPAAPPPAVAAAPPTKLGEMRVAAAPPAAAPIAVASKPVDVANKKVEPKAAAAPDPAPVRAVPVVAPRRLVELAAAPPSSASVPVIIKPAEAPARPLPPAPEPVYIAQKNLPAFAPTTPNGPRLERLSLGEVALITSGGPQWRSKVISRTAQSTTVRFVPLRQTAARLVRIRLLNAARHEGLAARTRRLLAQRGWRQLAIGNARRVRQSSLVLYPAHQRALAKRLAAQFGIPLAKNASGTDLVVLLGRDAARSNPVRWG